MQLQIAVTITFALALTGALQLAPPALPGICQQLVIASSDEKFTMLHDALAVAYNAQDHFVDGRCVRVSVEHVNSGEAEQLLERNWAGTDQARPDVWSPAGTAWVNLLKQRAPAAAAQVLPPSYDSLFQSPTVIAMPAVMARALGYPGRAIGWSDIFALVNDPNGWASLGMPWGRFKLAKTNPNISTSGLHALIGAYDAAGGTTPATVASPSARAFVGKIETAVVHYAPTAKKFLAALADADAHGQALDYMSAVVIEEQEMVEYNASSPAPRTPLVAIYPKEGTPVDDHPYVELKGSNARAAAEDFKRYVDSRTDVTDRDFFRDRFGSAGPALASQPGVSATLPVGRLTAPQGAVLQAMLTQWQTLRKRARVLVLVDAGAGKLGVQRAGQLAAAVTGFQPTDDVGVWSFPPPSPASAPYAVVRPLGPANNTLVAALGSIRPVAASGNLEQVIGLAVASMSASFSADAVDAILVVEMAPRPRTAADQQLETTLRNQPADRFVRVFTVGPSKDVRLDDLALAGRGAAYSVDNTTGLLTDVVASF